MFGEIPMNRFLSGAALLLGALLMAPAALAGPKDPQHFIADILRLEGEDYVVKDQSGVEGKIHVGADTEKYGHFQPGDRIDAWVYPNGHAKTVIIVRSAAAIQEDQQREAAQQRELVQR